MTAWTTQGHDLRWARVLAMHPGWEAPLRGRAQKCGASLQPTHPQGIRGGKFMAQKVQVLLVDDIDGGKADETVQFGLDGVSYEIDLSQERAEAAGRVRRLRRGGPPGRRARQRRAAGPGEPAGSGRGDVDVGAVREWARANGHQVSDRGRVPARSWRPTARRTDHLAQATGPAYRGRAHRGRRTCGRDRVRRAARTAAFATGEPAGWNSRPARALSPDATTVARRPSPRGASWRHVE